MEAIPLPFSFSAFPSFSVLVSLSDCGKKQAGRELTCKLRPVVQCRLLMETSRGGKR